MVMVIGMVMVLLMRLVFVVVMMVMVVVVVPECHILLSAVTVDCYTGSHCLPKPTYGQQENWRHAGLGCGLFIVVRGQVTNITVTALNR